MVQLMKHSVQKCFLIKPYGSQKPQDTHDPV